MHSKESLLAHVTKDQLEQLKFIISQGDWSPLIAYAKQAVQNLDENEAQWTLWNIYQGALFLALDLQEDVFVENIVQHEQVLKHIDQRVLFAYSLKKPEEFLKTTLTEIAKHPAKLCHVFSSDFIFRELFKEWFSQDSVEQIPIDNQTEKCIRVVLNITNIDPQIKEIYLRRWTEEYYFASRKNGYSQKKRDLFCHFLPLNTADMQVIFSVMVSFLSENQDEFNLLNREILHLVKTYALSTETIICALENSVLGGSSLLHLNKMIELLDAKHPKYQRYRLLCDLINKPAEEKANFILANPKMISTEMIPDNLQYNIITYVLTKENKKFFIEWYITHSDFEYGPKFKEYVFEFDEELITAYFSCPHVQLPYDCLQQLVFHSSKLKNLSSLIKIIISRPDFVFEVSTIIRPLYSLFTGQDRNSIDVLLNNSSVFTILKKFDQLGGNDYLPHYERGNLMPSVLGSLVTTDKFQELYLSFSESARREILTKPLLPIVDSEQSPVIRFIIKSGRQDVIELVGAIAPRFITHSSANKLVVTAPIFWRNPKVLRGLRIIQQRKASAFAEKKKEEEKKEFCPGIMSLDKHLDFAKTAAEAHAIESLHLLHQTPLPNVRTILATNSLKTRQHIQGHLLTGKTTNGLTQSATLLGAHDQFCYFTRKPMSDKLAAGVQTFSVSDPLATASFLVNLPKLLEANPHINFIVIGSYGNAVRKTLKLSDEFTLDSDKIVLQGMQEIRFNNAKKAMAVIHQLLFEILFNKLITLIPDPLKQTVIEKILKPKSEEDRQLARDLIDLIGLKWLIPGDVPLKLCYIDRIEFSGASYDLVTLRNKVQESSEEQVLIELGKFRGIDQFPFVINAIMKIAFERKHYKVLNTLRVIPMNNPQEIVPVYYPSVLYQVVSLAQLMLEDLNDDRIYGHYTDDTLKIYTTLKHDNRGGAHHAEMAKLYYALSMGNLQNQNALRVFLEDILTISTGETAQFKSLADVRNALLTYELTTLITSYQNQQYYQNNKGQFHPITGKGATNGTVALLGNRLFLNDKPFKIQVVCDDDKRQILIVTDNLAAQQIITDAINKLLSIPRDKISATADRIIIDIPVTTLIAKLRKQAVFYEGINVITETGHLLLAYRHGKGYATAGGHHGGKYCPLDIAYGLYSEFDLILKDPENLEQHIIQLTGVKTISKTGIFIIHAQHLISSKKGNSQLACPFVADPEEFTAGSELSLTLTEMRGKEFYDVMPLAELCQYQLDLLSNYLKEHAGDVKLTVSIDKTVNNVAHGNVIFKVPAENFGEITIISERELPTNLRELFESKGKVLKDEKSAKVTYKFDESPLLLLSMIREMAQPNRLRCHP